MEQSGVELALTWNARVVGSSLKHCATITSRRSVLPVFLCLNTCTLHSFWLACPCQSLSGNLSSSPLLSVSSLHHVGTTGLFAGPDKATARFWVSHSAHHKHPPGVRKMERSSSPLDNCCGDVKCLSGMLDSARSLWLFLSRAVRCPGIGPSMIV